MLTVDLCNGENWTTCFSSPSKWLKQACSCGSRKFPCAAWVSPHVQALFMTLPKSHLLPSIPLVKASCMIKFSVSVGKNYLSCGCWRGKHLWLLLQSDYSSSSWPLRSTPLPTERPIRLIFISTLLLFYCPPPGTLFLPIFGQRPVPLSNDTSYLSLLSKLDGILSYMAHLIQTLMLPTCRLHPPLLDQIFLKGFDCGLLIFAFLWHPANNFKSIHVAANGKMSFFSMAE